MRIAVLNQSYPPMISGAALFSGHLAEALAERGHEVLVLAASDQGKAYLQRCDNLTVQRFHSYPNPHRVEQRFLLWPANEIKAALQDFAPEVIHLHEPFQMAYFARLYARQRGVPCILTIHALPTLVSRQFEALVTPTETIATMVAERTGVRPRVVSGGVDLRIFRPAPLHSETASSLRKELGIREGAQIMLHVGRLDAGKNVQGIIRAAGLTMRESSRDVALLCVGDGCEKAQIMKLAVELGIADNCHFPGYITEARRLAAIYGMADLFCTASEIETQGLVLLEATACGLPLVAVKATAIHEIVSDGVNGFLVPAGDASRMAEAMTTILQDSELSKKMGFASRQASFAHDFNRTVAAYEEIYLAVIHDRAAQKTGNKALADQMVTG